MIQLMEAFITIRRVQWIRLNSRDFCVWPAFVRHHKFQWASSVECLAGSADACHAQGSLGSGHGRRVPAKKNTLKIYPGWIMQSVYCSTGHSCLEAAKTKLRLHPFQGSLGSELERRNVWYDLRLYKNNKRLYLISIFDLDAAIFCLLVSHIFHCFGQRHSWNRCRQIL